MRALIPLLLALAGCQQQNATTRLIAERCGACHIVPGVAGANGRVGPSLAGIGRQQIIAGRFPNEPIDMQQWLQHPQAMKPGTSMPDLGVTQRDAGDIAAYLATLH